MMNIYLLIFLRVIHVFTGALWVGVAIFYFFFIKPSIQAIGPAAPKFIQSLVTRRKYPVFMGVISMSAIVSGGILYWRASEGFNLIWIQTGPGIGFTIGALAGFAALFAGGIGIVPTTGRLQALGNEIAQSGGDATPEQQNMMRDLERKLTLAEVIDFCLLTISMVTMATARYWLF